MNPFNAWATVCSPRLTASSGFSTPVIFFARRRRGRVLKTKPSPVVLDAWPLVRYALGESKFVTAIGELFGGRTPVIVSSINLGEVHHIIARRKGAASADRMWNDTCNRAQVEAPTLELTRNAARLVLTSRIPWADAHAAATAIAHNAVLWVGDRHLNKPGLQKRRDVRNLGDA